MHPRPFTSLPTASGLAVCGVLAIFPAAMLQASPAPSASPITKVARVINPELARLETQVAHAENRLQTLEHPRGHSQPALIVARNSPASPQSQENRPRHPDRDGDGATAEMAAAAGEWHERALIEAELRELRAGLQTMATASEINVIWGSAILLGLTVLIPAFLVGHRRHHADQRLDQLRQRIAADLHDDIGSNLGSISLIARSARKDLGKSTEPTDIARDLDEVETIARESSLAMRDIVWLLETQADSVGDLVMRMREMGKRLLRDLDHSIECRSSRTSTRLSMDAKRHLFLFFKEAVHNVGKHAAATRVDVVLADEGDLLVLEIRDNGRGIANDVVNQPASLSKLRERARVLSARLHIDSSPGNGTCIRLDIRPNHLHSHTGS